MDYINSSIYLFITVTLILSLVAGMVFTLHSFEQQRQLNDTINRRQKEKETETLKKIAGEYLHQKVINGMILPHLINLKETSQLLNTGRGGDKKAIVARFSNLIDEMIEMESVVRNISENIYPSHLSEYFVPVCQQHLKDLEKKWSKGGEKVIFETDNMLTDLKPYSTLLYNLYSVIDLFVTNSLKHAKATEVKVYLTRKKGLLLLNMSDDGKGFDIKAVTLATKGRGLADFKSRAMALAPSFVFESERDKGTKFSVAVNLNAWKN